VPCKDLGDVVEYGGDASITTTCKDAHGSPIRWTTGHAVGTTPNEVVLTPNTAIELPTTSQSGSCVVEFDIKVAKPQCSQKSPSADKPCTIMQFAGYMAPSAGAVSGNTFALGLQQSGALPVCNPPTGQPCDDGDPCTADTCDTAQTGKCVFTRGQCAGR